MRAVSSPDDRPEPSGAEHLPASLRLERTEDVATLRLSRPGKRNALDDATILGLEWFFSHPPAWAKVVVLEAEGDHFSAGLDLNELTERSTVEGLEHSMLWHRAFHAAESGRLPVIAVLAGAVIGGGLELAAAAHIRVAETSTFYALPEGQRGLFVGGGASVRLPKLIGTHRVVDMMLTGRVLDAEEGHRVGLSQYLVGAGEGRELAMRLAATVAANAPLTNFAILQALPRIAEADGAQGYLLESLMASVATGSDDAKQRMREFLNGRSAKVDVVKGEG